MVVRVKQEHTQDWIRSSVDDAIKIVGEPVISLKMFSAINPSPNRCPHCFDDIYTNTTTSLEGMCNNCFGTTYEGGIDKIYFTHAIVGSQTDNDNFTSKRGQFESTMHDCKLSWPSDLKMNDYIIRVFDWEAVPEGFLAKDIEVHVIKTSVRKAFVKDGLEAFKSVKRIGSDFTVQLQDTTNELYNEEFIVEKPAFGKIIG